MENKVKKSLNNNWFDKYYKLLALIPIIILIVCLVYLFNFYQVHGDIILKDTSLAGGTILTLTGNLNFTILESKLNSDYNDISFRKLTDLKSGEVRSFIIETDKQPEEIKSIVEKILSTSLTNEDYSIEFTGSSLSLDFYKQLVFALVISFILMSVVVLFLFRTIVPSLAVIFAAFADIVMPLALVNLLGIKLSAAGIAAFLMLLGYSVDTDILLTTRALKKKEGTLNQRIHGAFKVGIFMTLTSLFAVLPAYFIMNSLPDSFRQIFIVLSIGLFADIINTWLTNVGIIKWYCTKKGIV